MHPALLLHMTAVKTVATRSRSYLQTLRQPLEDVCPDDGQLWLRVWREGNEPLWGVRAEWPGAQSVRQQKHPAAVLWASVAKPNTTHKCAPQVARASVHSREAEQLDQKKIHIHVEQNQLEVDAALSSGYFSYSSSINWHWTTVLIPTSRWSQTVRLSEPPQWHTRSWLPAVSKPLRT